MWLVFSYALYIVKHVTELLFTAFASALYCGRFYFGAMTAAALTAVVAAYAAAAFMVAQNLLGSQVHSTDNN